MRFLINETFLLLGGGGMVGRQITQEIARELNPHHIIICSLTQEEVDDTIRRVKKDFPEISITGVAGDIFLRHEWNPSSGHGLMSREQLMEDGEHRKALYEDLFGSLQGAYERSELVWLIRQYAPNVIIDSINTATAFSYQDVYSASDLAKRDLDALESSFRDWQAKSADKISGQAERDSGNRPWLLEDGLIASIGRDFERALISQSVPQLVRHVLLLNMAMKEADTRLYMKIGTTGTGGMGLNIPYTHSEDKPSATLMEKTAIAFAHTGLMFLMARTLGGPAVKEFKPAAMIGYADIGLRQIRVKPKGKVGEPGKKLQLYSSQTESLEATGSLRLRPSRGQGDDGYDSLGDLNMILVNTGENGFFTKGEFQAITYMRQMEFITPEEIARQVVLEIKGGNTGYDVIAAIDGATISPTYRAGYLRHLALEELEKMEKEKKIPSVALGELGPPELGKLLWEAYLIQAVYGSKEGEEKENELDKVLARSPDEMAEEIFTKLQSEAELRNAIVSVGLPILIHQGQSLIRGPYIRIPERPNEDVVSYGQEDVEAWAAKGWVDLRPRNMERWQQRFARMKRETERIRERGSAAFTREAYLSGRIQIGAVVGWIFNNEENFGYRIK